MVYLYICLLVYRHFQVTDQADICKLETNNGLLSPKISSTSSVPSPSTYNLQTPYVKLTKAMETLHEKSNDFNSDSLDSSTCSSRKRKLLSPATNTIKRRKNICYSESTKRKFSDLFRTPVGYFSNRRKTIATITNQTDDDSVLSNSGIFDVTLENQSTTSSFRSVRKNLFSRTFSSTKFGRSLKRSSSKRDFSMSESEIDGNETLNSSCFPEILSQTKHYVTSETQRKKGFSLTNNLVLTSFHLVFGRMFGFFQSEKVHTFFHFLLISLLWFLGLLFFCLLVTI